MEGMGDTRTDHRGSDSVVRNINQAKAATDTNVRSGISVATRGGLNPNGDRLLRMRT